MRRCAAEHEPIKEYDLVDLVEKAQEELLASSNEMSTEQVMQWVATALSRRPSPEEVQAIEGALCAHPSLVPVVIGKGLWKRGADLGPPRRNFIGMERR